MTKQPEEQLPNWFELVDAPVTPTKAAQLALKVTELLKQEAKEDVIQANFFEATED